MRRRGLAVAMVGLFLIGCAAREDTPYGAGQRPLQLRVEEVPAPDVFARDATGRRDEADGVAGLWAVVPGLPRPERARLENRATGASAVVALFMARPAARSSEIVISHEAAEAIGMRAAVAPVRLTALRTEPRLTLSPDRF